MRLLFIVLVLSIALPAQAKKKAPLIATYTQLMSLSPKARATYLRDLGRAFAEFDRAAAGETADVAALERNGARDLQALLQMMPEAVAADVPDTAGVPILTMKARGKRSVTIDGQRSSQPAVKYKMDCGSFAWSPELGTCYQLGSEKSFSGEIAKERESFPCTSANQERVGVWNGGSNYTSYCVTKGALGHMSTADAGLLRSGRAKPANAPESGIAAINDPSNKLGRALKSYGGGGSDMAGRLGLAKSTSDQVAASPENQAKAAQARGGDMLTQFLREQNGEAQPASVVDEKANLAKGERELMQQLNDNDSRTGPNALKAGLAKRREKQEAEGEKLILQHLNERDIAMPGMKKPETVADAKASQETASNSLQDQINKVPLNPLPAVELQAGEDECSDYRCDGATSGDPKAADEWRKAWKKSGKVTCTMGGMTSKYKNNKVTKGNCEAITQLRIMGDLTLKCGPSETMCNPALYCNHGKKDQEAVICVNVKKAKQKVQATCRDMHQASWKDSDDATNSCIDSNPFSGAKELYESTVKSYEELCFGDDKAFRGFFCEDCDMLSLRIQNANRLAFKKKCLVSKTAAATPAAAPAGSAYEPENEPSNTGQ